MKPTHPSIQQHIQKAKKVATDVTAIELKTDYITVAQAVNLDTMESNIATNNAKVTYPSAHNTIVAALPADAAARITALEAKMQFQPKAFGRFTTIATPALLSTSYNVASVSKTSTGIYAIVIDTDMTTANYTVMLSYEDATATIQTVMASNIATTGFSVALRDADNALSDVSESVSFVVFENNT